MPYVELVLRHGRVVRVILRHGRVVRVILRHGRVVRVLLRHGHLMRVVTVCTWHELDNTHDEHRLHIHASQF